MSVFNRAFVSMIALAWCAALAAAVYLVWEQARDIAIDSDILTLDFDLIFDTQAERILASLVLGGLALPAFLLLAIEMVPQGPGVDRRSRRESENYGAMQARVDSLEKQLSEERGLRKLAFRDVDRERKLLREQAARDAGRARSVPVAVAESREPRRRYSWHMLSRRS